MKYRTATHDITTDIMIKNKTSQESKNGSLVLHCCFASTTRPTNNKTLIGKKLIKNP